jgi:hypothetical protein
LRVGGHCAGVSVRLRPGSALPCAAPLQMLESVRPPRVGRQPPRVAVLAASVLQQGDRKVGPGANSYGVVVRGSLGSPRWSGVPRRQCELALALAID